MSTNAPPPAAAPPERRHFPRRWHRARRALYGLLSVMALGVVAYVGLRKVEPPQLDLVMPTRARVGDVVILSGSAFARRPEDNTVLVGDYAARVLEATRNRLLIEVPDMALDPGERKTATVRVTVGSTQSKTLEITVDSAPELEPGADAPEDDDDARPTPRPRVTTPSPR
ncbi:MAG: hypothetical protein DMF83_03810 [Acidobacteria bacterium]|nr:MAG: hypothetical protein DMF83_03810 [Acidobacteriota bacterium]